MSACKFVGALLVLFLCCAASLAASPAMAQEPLPRPSTREHVQRWRDMKSERKQVMRQRLQEFHSMRADKRQAKLERVKRLREIMSEIYREMDTPTRARVDALDPAKRAQLLGNLALEEARSRSREARLILGSGKGRNPDRGRPGASSHEQRKKTHEQFLSKARKRLEAHVQKHGLPKGFSQEDWQHFRGLQGRLFGRELRKLAHQYPQWVEVMGPPPGRRTIDRERWELHQAMRLPPHERRELVRTPGKDSRAQELVRRRERIMKVLKKHKSLSEERRKAVESFSNREFMHWMRERLGPPIGHPGAPGFRPGTKPGVGSERRPDLGPHPRRRPPGERRFGPPDKARQGAKRTGPGVSPHPKKRRGPRPALPDDKPKLPPHG